MPTNTVAGSAPKSASNPPVGTWGRAKQFFRVALRERLIGEYLISDMKGLSVQANKAREFFVHRATTAKLHAACIDNQWKLLVGLARYASLRTPSESWALT